MHHMFTIICVSIYKYACFNAQLSGNLVTCHIYSILKLSLLTKKRIQVHACGGMYK